MLWLVQGGPVRRSAASAQVRQPVGRARMAEPKPFERGSSDLYGRQEHVACPQCASERQWHPGNNIRAVPGRSCGHGRLLAAGGRCSLSDGLPGCRNDRSRRQAAMADSVPHVAGPGRKGGRSLAEHHPAPECRPRIRKHAIRQAAGARRRMNRNGGEGVRILRLYGGPATSIRVALTACSCSASCLSTSHPIQPNPRQAQACAGVGAGVA
jgi:hypothetical protein